MQNLQKILVPTDFSEAATGALIYAINLAENISAVINVLHVSEENEATEAIKEKFENLRHHYFFNRKCEVVFKIRPGDVQQSIEDEVESARIDLIVIGMSDKIGVREMLTGSVTAKLIDKPPCALIGVPHNCKVLTPKKIAIATDNQSTPNPPQLYVLNFLSEAFNSTISIFHVMTSEGVSETDSKTVKEAFDALFQYNLHNFLELESDDVLQAIEDFTVTNDVDLLTLMHHTTTHDAARRSISKQLAFKIQVPLLVIPIQ